VATAGTQIYQTATLDEPAATVLNRVIQAASGVPGYSVTSTSPTSVIITRKFTPTWAVVVGVLGLLLFLIGVLFFFVKTTETLSVTLSEAGGKTTVALSGNSTPVMTERLQWAMTPQVAA
jgi:hypothetical protein